MLPRTVSSALWLTFLTTSFCYGQDSLVSRMAQQNRSTFNFRDGQMSGPGWETLVEESKKTRHVLIGEDHFTNEIPTFTSALATATPFDNYFLELDPITTELITNKLSSLKEDQLKSYITQYQTTFSFLAFAPELDLIKKLLATRTKVLGTEQIFLLGDRLLAAEFKHTTSSAVARSIYEKIEVASEQHYRKFLKDQKSPFYFLTEEFMAHLKSLQALHLSDGEQKAIDQMLLSRQIYTEQNHHLRIQLMKKQMIAALLPLQGTRSLFKYGAVHMPKGESLLRIFDLGNLVNTIADSQMDESLHIMIVGQTGAQGSPFDGFPPSPLDPLNGDLKFLQPFFKQVAGKDHHLFHLRPLREELEKGRIIIRDKWLLRTIKGYDYLVIIPEVTPAKFSYR